MVSGSHVINEFKAQSIHQIALNKPRIEKCLKELTEEEVWKRPNQSSNSVGNLMLHLCGNIRQYVISSLGEKPDVRSRDEEFSAKGGYSKKELLNKLSETVAEAIQTIRDAPDTTLLKERSVQGFNYSGIGIVIHVTEHYSYHVGQIAFWTKLLKNKDLGFYSGIDLGIKNED